MIKEIISEEVEKSKAKRQTTSRLKNIVFSIIENSLTKQYDGKYQDKCLQSSMLIKETLTEFGIKSYLIKGALCFLRIGRINFNTQWNGFWDDQYHCWVVTEFDEVIDLTISQYGITSKDYNQYHSMFPVWWSPGSELPPLLRYLPDSPKSELQPVFEGEDQIEYDQLHLIFENVKSQILNSNKSDLKEKTILQGNDTLNELHYLGNPWCLSYLQYTQNMPQYPPWIENRHKQLMKGYK